MGPICKECGKSEFGTHYVTSGLTYLVHCTECGHIVCALPDHVELAKAIAQKLSGGSRDQTGHPVIHVKTEEQVFG